METIKCCYKIVSKIIYPSMEKNQLIDVNTKMFEWYLIDMYMYVDIKTHDRPSERMKGKQNKDKDVLVKAKQKTNFGFSRAMRHSHQKVKIILTIH